MSTNQKKKAKSLEQVNEILKKNLPDEVWEQLEKANRQRKYIAIDTKTREAVQENYRVVKDSTKENNRRKAATRSFKQSFVKREFVACLDNGMKEFTSKLSKLQRGALCMLTLYMKIDKDGYLVKGKDDKPMTTQDIAAILNRDIKNTRKIIKALVDSSAVVNHGTAYKPLYQISPSLHMMGTMTNKMMFTKLFKVEAREMDKLTILDWGFLWSIAPYISFKNGYVLAENPYETDAERVKPLSRKQIAEIVDDSERTVKRQLDKLGDLEIIMTSRLGKKEAYTIRPSIIWRGNDVEGYLNCMEAVEKHFFIVANADVQLDEPVTDIEDVIDSLIEEG